MADTKLVICEKCWGTGQVHGGEENSTWSKTCEDCHGIGFVRVPMTNADHIRAMSDEELAKLIAENAYTGACNDFGIPHQGQCCHNCERCDAIIKWLKHPAE